jgi:hypothetical protein
MTSRQQQRSPRNLPQVILEILPKYVPLIQSSFLGPHDLYQIEQPTDQNLLTPTTDVLGYSSITVGAKTNFQSSRLFPD